MATLHFSVDSALLSELGEKLVESTHVALLELVKNAYDADATKTVVAMIPQGESYEIRVKDNGSGMTLKQVREYWMRIATTNKANEAISNKYGRRKSGSKGIGRFSCRRLGTKLRLTTTAKVGRSRYKTTEFDIDWKKFRPGTDVTEITCEGSTTSSSKGKTGTQLVITGGKADEWSTRGWRVLKRRLILLVSNKGANRKGFRPDPGFNVSLTAPDFEESTVVDPREQFMDAGWGRLKLKVKKDGTAKWTLTAKRLGTKHLTLPAKYPKLSQTTADIAILPGDKRQFRNRTAVAITQLRATLDEWGGVKVRANGIRVPPYGEDRNDWLRIDYDRGLRKGASEFSPVRQLAAKLRGVTVGRELLNMLSSKSYLGEVNAASPTDLFDMKASRDGFVGERGIETLRRIVRHGIDWSTVYRDYYLRLEEEDEAQEARQAFEDVVDVPTRAEDLVENAVTYVEQEIRQMATHLPEEDRRQVVHNLTKATKAILQSDELHRQELRHLRLVAATSSLLLIFSHEVRSLLSVLDEYSMRLSVLKKGLPSKPSAQIDEMKARFVFTKKRFDDLLGMTSLLAIDSKNAEPTPLALSSRVRKAAKCFSLITQNYDIDIDCADIPNAIKVGPMLEAELYSIFLNAFSNAIKSVIAGAKRKKRIKVIAQSNEQGVRINIMDSGIGVPRNWQELFVPFVADPEGKLYGLLHHKLNPEDKHVVGTGSGLGLSIMKEIVESHDGTARFTRAPKGYNCNLEIVLG